MVMPFGKTVVLYLLLPFKDTKVKNQNTHRHDREIITEINFSVIRSRKGLIGYNGDALW